MPTAGPDRARRGRDHGRQELPNEHVIHCLGPRYGQDELADGLLARCYREALALADQEALASVGFPAISTGAFGYPRGGGRRGEGGDDARGAGEARPLASEEAYEVHHEVAERVLVA